MDHQPESNQVLQNPVTNQAHSYFNLIEKVGSNGKYQRNIFILFSINWFLCGFLILQTGFLFFNRTFNCQSQGLLIQHCSDSICLLDSEQRQYFLAPQQVNSLTTQFGPYLCQQSLSLSFLKTILFVGVLCGYLFFFYFTDNYGRKFSLVMAWGCTCFGITLLVVAQNIQMAAIGLFFAGAGCQTSTKINMAALSEIVQYYKRQIYSVALEISFGFSGICIALSYYFIKQWRLINAVFVVIPSFVLLFFFIFYLEETPMFLLKKQNKKCLQGMNRIGYINTGNKSLITQQDIQNVKKRQNKGQTKAIKLTMMDLFKFKSLRKITIPNMIISMVISYLYITPSFVVDKLGLNPYVTLIVVALSQLLAYPTSMFFIKKLKRTSTGMVCFVISSLLSLLLVIKQKPQNCNGQCFQAYLEIICVFIGRFLISFYYAIFFVFISQLYPGRARGTGLGIGSAMGSVGSISGNVLIGYFYQQKINPQILNIVFGLLAFFSLFFLPQTFNEPLKDEIQEIQNKQTQKSILVQNERNSI